MADAAQTAEFRRTRSRYSRICRPDQSTKSGAAAGSVAESNLAARQSRAASFTEALANVIVGYCVAIGAQQLMFPLFGFEATLAQHGAIAAGFTLISLVRSYLLRRIFEHLSHLRQVEEHQRLWRLQQRYRTGIL